jgi:hypothetical protein
MCRVAFRLPFLAPLWPVAVTAEILPRLLGQLHRTRTIEFRCQHLRSPSFGLIKASLDFVCVVAQVDIILVGVFGVPILEPTWLYDYCGARAELSVFKRHHVRFCDAEVKGE